MRIIDHASAVGAPGTPPAGPHAVEGRTALIIPLLGLGRQVDRWRQRADPIAPYIPAHITVLFPFRPWPDIESDALAQLADLFSAVPARTVHLDSVGTFPSVVWLRPSPADWLVDLTRRVWDTWPEHPPYEGVHDEIVPHLTVAHGVEHASAINADLRPVLPLSARAEAVHLVAFGDGAWADRARFPLGR